MIDPNEPLEVQVVRQARIIEALIGRAERSHELGGSAYSLFQSAIALQAEVWEKTRTLEEALDTLGRASGELEVAYRSRERTEKTLADVMVAMEGGFALFSEDRLQVCNRLFRQLLPDVEPLIQPGLLLEDFLEALRTSRHVRREGGRDADALMQLSTRRRLSSFIIPLRGERFYQLSLRKTGAETTAVLLTEVTDIVRQNRQEKRLLIEGQEHFLQTTFDHLALGICTFSARGEVQASNERFAELLALPLSLLAKGVSLTRLVEHLERHGILQEEGVRLVFPGWFKSVLRGRRVQRLVRRSDGFALDLQAHGLPRGGFVVTVMDVTAQTEAADLLERRVQERTAELTEANRQLQRHAKEQAQTEDALRQAKEAAEAAHVSKTRFLAAASHDLLQPINAAKLYISTLRETVGSDRARDTVDRLSRSFASIETLLQSLLEISRLDSTGAEFNITSFCLDEPLRSLQEDLAPLAAQKGLALHVEPSSAWVRSDRRYLMRSIRNLAVNAIQYTQSGRILIGCRLRGQEISVQVWDTGVGISPENQTRIFEEFTRLGEGGGGSGMGLGLSIVQRACRHLGHEVRLQSRRGRGSMFAIDLPMVRRPGEMRSANRAQPVEPMSPHGGLDLIILAIENDPDVLHAMTQRLDSWGAGVLACASTEEALALMEDIGTPPDIIIADYQLNGEDTGVQAIRALRAAARVEVPAIVISARSSKDLLQLGRDEAFSVMKKPVNLPRLRALIDWKTRPQVA